MRPQGWRFVIHNISVACENKMFVCVHVAAWQMSLVEAAKVGDLEAEATPESIMLSTMTEEGEKERADREMVVPWLKFLWETYRAVLDILKTNTKLEHVYHATCIKAFNFCR